MQGFAGLCFPGRAEGFDDPIRVQLEVVKCLLVTLGDMVTVHRPANGDGTGRAEDHVAERKLPCEVQSAEHLPLSLSDSSADAR